MGEKTDVWRGTLALMMPQTLETMGPQHGYGLVRRIVQTSGDLPGTLLPLPSRGALASANHAAHLRP